MIRKEENNRWVYFSSVFFLIAAVIVIKLFFLQVVEHKSYAAFALSTHEIYRKLHPRRGAIFIQDSRSKTEYPVAVNRNYELIYAVPKEIDALDRQKVTDKLAEILKFDEAGKESLLQKISKDKDPYEPVAKKVDDETAEKIKAEKLPGVYLTPQEFRYYPEGELAAGVLGFFGLNKDGNPEGQYGVEGYWESTLAGKSGWLSGEKGAGGSWIALAERTTVPSEDGADILLTIDRALELKACARLEEEMKNNKAKSASLIIMEAKTGAIRAMCSLPDFNPNDYSRAESVSAFNNTSIFTPYEPGSVFKPITMAAAIDLGLVDLLTTFVDPCVREINGHKIHNALNKCYGTQTMTGILENSINTGMIWVVERVGRERFFDYVKKFGFGERLGVPLYTEAAGDISSLEKPGEIYAANGSFGQGLTATLLQLVTAYATLANDGQTPAPFIVEEIRYPNGHKEKTEEKIIDNVISPKAAKIITGMLTAVIENKYKSKAGLPDYFLAGKTGTAQIPGKGGYSEETNHTFTGYGPVSDPRLVMAVRFEAPKSLWAESTAAPVFRDIMKFALNYYGIEPDKK